MAKQMVYAFADEPSLIRVAQAAQGYHGVARNHYQTRLPSIPNDSTALWLVRATAIYTASSIGQFVIQHPTGGKGDEADGETTISAWVRKGLVFEDAIYTAIEVCPGDDSIFEIVNPELTFVGETNEVITNNTSGEVLIFKWNGINGYTNTGTIIEDVFTFLGGVSLGATVECAWVGGIAGTPTFEGNIWRITQTDGCL